MKITSRFLICLCLLSFASESYAALVLHYAFNDQDNLSLDSSGNAHTAINFGATFTATGNRGGGATFANTSYMRAPLDVNQSVRPQMTWGAWVNPTNVTPNKAILSSGNGGFDRAIYIDSRGGPQPSWATFTGNFGVGVDGVFNSGISPQLSEWVFLATVYDNPTGSLTFYVNDQSFTPPITNYDTAVNGFFDIGRNPTFGQYFQGTMDDVFLFDTALSPVDIAQIRTNGIAAIPEPTSLSLLTIAMTMGLLWRRQKQTFTPRI